MSVLFIGNSHRHQLLDAASYASPEIFEAEKSALLHPAWHCVGVHTDLPKTGDFLTLTILEHPILVRRDEDGVSAFLNVCTHRFCMLTDQRRGHSPKIRCQYHGWEYDCEGQTRRIPDAPSFKPLRKGQLGLTRFRCQSRGQLIFVCLDPEAISLDEFLDNRGELIDRWFTDRWSPMMSYEEMVDCNWKTYLENGLESYHIDTVHASTLVKRPDEEQCEHDFRPRSTRFTVDQQAPDAVSRWLDRTTHRLLDLDPEPYQHVHVYPTLTFIRMSGFSYLEAVIPTSAESSMVLTRGFAYRGQRDRWYSGPLAVLTRRWGSRFLRKIQQEDVAILALNQAGMRSPQRPPGGFISTREERIFHFQEHVLSKLPKHHEQRSTEPIAAERNAAGEVDSNRNNPDDSFANKTAPNEIT